MSLLRSPPVVVAVSVLTLANDCRDGPAPDPGPNEPPAVGRVKMIPGAVTATPGASVRLRALLLTPSNKVIDPSQNVAVAWEWTAHPIDNMKVGTSSDMTPSFHQTTVTLPTVAAAGSVYGIRASASGVSADATIRIADAGDRVLADDASANETIAALEHAPCPTDRVIAFVGVATLDPLDHPCPLGLFTPDFAIAYLDAQWTTVTGDIVDYRGAGGPPPPGIIHRLTPFDPDPMNLEVWIAAIPGPADVLQNIAAEAQMNVNAAAEYLRGNRVGIVPVAAAMRDRQLDYTLGDAEEHCEDPAAYPLFDHPDLDMADEKRIYVFYVRSAVSAGVTCLPKTNRAGIIFIAAFGQVGNTLAHEITHALAVAGPGLTVGTDPTVVPQLPNWGHSENVLGLGPENLMLGTVDPGMKKSRDRLSIGQVFRMNIDTRSWINVALPQRIGTKIGAAIQCQDKITAGACPGLALDVPIN